MAGENPPRLASVKIEYEASYATIVVPNGIEDVDEWLATMSLRQRVGHIILPDDPAIEAVVFEEWC